MPEQETNEFENEIKEIIEKRKTVFCPIINSMCRTDCEAFEMPHMAFVIGPPPVHEYVTGGQCAHSFLHKSGGRYVHNFFHNEDGNQILPKDELKNIGVVKPLKIEDPDGIYKSGTLIDVERDNSDNKPWWRFW